MLMLDSDEIYSKYIQYTDSVRSVIENKMWYTVSVHDYAEIIGAKSRDYIWISRKYFLVFHLYSPN